jgi:hypothetical protein
MTRKAMKTTAMMGSSTETTEEGEAALNGWAAVAGMFNPRELSTTGS